MKEWKYPQEKTSKESEISNFPDKEFKEMVMRVLTKFEGGIEKLRENFNKEKNNEVTNRPKEHSNWNENCIGRNQQLIS